MAKNKRTYFHKDGNNLGSSYQVVVTDPDKVASGEFVAGNLLCWPQIGREDAARRSQEVHVFHEERRDRRKERRDDRRRKLHQLNPLNPRWRGDKDEVKETGEERLSESESDEDFVLHEKHVDVSNLKLEEDIEDVEDRALDSSQVPAYEEDATVVECVNQYVSFVGRDVWHATQPWSATVCTDGRTTKKRANRYCITFFAVDLRDGDGSDYKRELRSEIVGMGFRPHDVGHDSAICPAPATVVPRRQKMTKGINAGGIRPVGYMRLARASQSHIQKQELKPKAGRSVKVGRSMKAMKVRQTTQAMRTTRTLRR